MQKTILLGTLLLSLTIPALADDDSDYRKGPPGGGRGPQLTDAQRSCIESQLGGSPREVKATMEQMKAAASSCGIEMPEPPQGHGHRDASDDDQ